MTLQEFNEINWHRGNVVKLENGKEYLVKGTKGHGKYLLLYSLEYDKCFVADYNIVDCRTSDYEEPEEVYLEMKRQKREEAEAKREAERQERLRAKAERKQRNLEEQERAHREAVARKAAAKALRQKELEAKKAAPAKAESKPAKAESKPAKVEAKAAPKSEPKVVEAPKPVETPAPEAPRKRVRQRIKISSIKKLMS